MTTRITVHAGHGWPVAVVFIPVRNHGEQAQRRRSVVKANDTNEFCVHSTVDMRITEIQPGEEHLYPEGEVSDGDTH